MAVSRAWQNAGRDLGSEAVAIYEKVDRESLHARHADETVPLKSEFGYIDQQHILEIATATGPTRSIQATGSRLTTAWHRSSRRLPE
ncbi:MAG TPA: hypothetical protein DEP84_26315 [Chloroflexi bacterium]|nr:hypothetical protein [Chloroflexota bacterium]